MMYVLFLSMMVNAHIYPYVSQHSRCGKPFNETICIEDDGTAWLNQKLKVSQHKIPGLKKGVFKAWVSDCSFSTDEKGQPVLENNDPGKCVINNVYLDSLLPPKPCPLTGN